MEAPRAGVKEATRTGPAPEPAHVSFQQKLDVARSRSAMFPFGVRKEGEDPPPLAKDGERAPPGLLHDDSDEDMEHPTGQVDATDSAPLGHEASVE